MYPRRYSHFVAVSLFEIVGSAELRKREHNFSRTLYYIAILLSSIRTYRLLIDRLIDWFLSTFLNNLGLINCKYICKYTILYHINQGVCISGFFEASNNIALKLHGFITWLLQTQLSLYIYVKNDSTYFLNQLLSDLPSQQPNDNSWQHAFKAKLV